MNFRLPKPHAGFLLGAYLLAEAALLFGVYLFGLGKLRPFLPAAVTGSLPTWDAFRLAALLALVFLLRALRPAAWAAADRVPGGTRRQSLAIWSAVLAALGVLAVGLRLLDPRFDDHLFALWGLGSPRRLALFVASLPLAAAVEEIVFRGCQARLRPLVGPWPAILGVAAVFSLHHLAGGAAAVLGDHQATLLAGTAAGGLLLALAYEKTGSLPLAVAVHGVYNLLATFQAWLNVERRPGAEALVFALWILGAALGAWLLRDGSSGRDSGERGRQDTA